MEYFHQNKNIHSRPHLTELNIQVQAAAVWSEVCNARHTTRAQSGHKTNQGARHKPGPSKGTRHIPRQTMTQGTYQGTAGAHGTDQGTARAHGTHQGPARAQDTRQGTRHTPSCGVRGTHHAVRSWVNKHAKDE